MLAFGNDFAITFDGDALAGVTELLDQAANGEFCGELAGFAIDGEIQHGLILAREFIFKE